MKNFFFFFLLIFTAQLHAQLSLEHDDFVFVIKSDDNQTTTYPANDVQVQVNTQRNTISFRGLYDTRVQREVPLSAADFDPIPFLRSDAFGGGETALDPNKRVQVHETSLEIKEGGVIHSFMPLSRVQIQVNPSNNYVTFRSITTGWVISYAPFSEISWPESGNITAFTGWVRENAYLNSGGGGGGSGGLSFQDTIMYVATKSDVIQAVEDWDRCYIADRSPTRQDSGRIGECWINGTEVFVLAKTEDTPPVTQTQTIGSPVNFLGITNGTNLWVSAGAGASPPFSLLDRTLVQKFSSLYGGKLSRVSIFAQGSTAATDIRVAIRSNSGAIIKDTLFNLVPTSSTNLTFFPNADIVKDQIFWLAVTETGNAQVSVQNDNPYTFSGIYNPDSSSVTSQSFTNADIAATFTYSQIGKEYVWAQTAGNSKIVATNSTVTTSDTTSSATYKPSRLNQTISVGTYRFEANIAYQTPLTTTGIGFGVQMATGAATVIGRSDIIPSTTVTTTSFHSSITAISGGQPPASFVTTTSVTSANTPLFASLSGVLNVTTSGVFQITFASEIQGSLCTILPNSSLIITKI